ncbi:enoyl-CoA hydratase/isomerase family protein [Psychrobacter phenylpyruvicus]|uniref:3-hydroxyisobutyryl-CoA hydrolase n=1 Tax=Psychrobacter phenylpyruvicus TaxID=29432 RepID=A0A379LJX2_9GAMM|nr:enoyl-CoA hydratase/isomerase family protein [Psychrobacter phenylpyruvicus]SUD90906.1 Probable enoyl-CoA hydratase echA8 [Psychrobacter phenylpyruvicus]
MQLNKTSLVAEGIPAADSTEVLFEEIKINQGLLIGLVTLNREKSLNALTTNMCKLISAKLTEWEQIDNLVAVVIHGAGERALCAGGDIRQLYQARQEWDGEGIAPPEAVDFFASEYHLDTQMHEYHKPTVIWGSGIVMGGGMGILSSSSHRIVTETTRAAMPEVNIGLFPDATGSWFLQRFPAKTGLFMGLTGADANANDALLCNLADFKMSSQDFDAMLQSLCEADWSEALGQPTLNSLSSKLHQITTKALSDFSAQSAANIEFAPSNIAKFMQSIQRLMNCGGLDKIDDILQSDENIKNFCPDLADSDWCKAAVANYRYGCPVTKAITYEMYQRAHNLSLTEVMALETNVALHCVNYPDFSEGVRALLVDKDRQPKWSRTLAECLDVEGQAYIQGHFEELH